MTDQEEKPTVMVACRRGKDIVTKGQECSSRMAYQLSTPGGVQAQFRCVKCGHIWTVPLGGKFQGV